MEEELKALLFDPRVVQLLAVVIGVAIVYGVAKVLQRSSDRLSGLTVAFGLAGAGIAFALQEVIASVAGWIAVSFGQFYNQASGCSLAA